MRIRTRLTLIVVTVLALSTVVLSSYLIHLERTYLVADSEERLTILINSAERAAREALLEKDDVLLVSYVKFLQRQHADLAYCHIEWQSPDKNRSITLGTTATAGDIRERVLRIADPRDPRRTVQMTLGIDRDVLEEKVSAGVDRLRRDLAKLSLVRLIVGLLLANWLAWSLSAPIHKLSAAVKEVAKGRLGHQIEWTSGDEVGELVAGFNQMSERLAELDTLKRDFVSSVTHELRSPLGAIDSFLRLIQGKGMSAKPQDVQQVQEYLGRIAANVRRLSGFINDLLDVAKIERGKMECVLRPMRLQEVAADVVQFFEAKSKEQQVGLTSKVPSDLPELLGDPERVRQVLVNLVSNALKFTPSGGHVWIGAEQFREGERRWAEISVTDTGRGIERGDFERLFKKFEQGRNATDGVVGPKGTGLGLFIVKSIAEAHGGKVAVRSAPGRGSQFGFTVSLA